MTPAEIRNAGAKAFAAEASFMKFKTHDLGQNGSMTLDDMRVRVKK